VVEGEFCVVCGRTDRPLQEGMCAECSADRLELVAAPLRPKVVLCPMCGARKVGSHWERSGTSTLLTAEDLTPLLRVHPEVGIRRVRWEETSQNPMLRDLHGTALVRFRGLEREVGVDLQVKIEHHTCPECSRRSGHYYTSILQLRGETQGPHESAAELRTRLEQQWQSVLPEMRSDWRKAISWSEALPEGWDFYLVDTLAARGVARLLKQRLGAEIKESATLFGRRNGQDVYRVTFCARIARNAGMKGARALERQVMEP
jgi:nonsense-mediated mRNA decay protein 3